MKCPKCGYLGFEHVDRCRNCQYDFSLASPGPEPDFNIRREPEFSNAVEELSLIDAASPWGAPPERLGEDGDLDRLFGAPEPKTDAAYPLTASSSVVQSAPRTASIEELPLFGPPIPDDEPLITRRAVACATPEPRQRAAHSKHLASARAAGRAPPHPGRSPAARRPPGSHPDAGSRPRGCRSVHDAGRAASGADDDEGVDRR